jgi:hypothetical protein
MILKIRVKNLSVTIQARTCTGVLLVCKHVSDVLTFMEQSHLSEERARAHKSVISIKK